MPFDEGLKRDVFIKDAEGKTLIGKVRHESYLFHIFIYIYIYFIFTIRKQNKERVLQDDTQTPPSVMHWL